MRERGWATGCAETDPFVIRLRLAAPADASSRTLPSAAPRNSAGKTMICFATSVPSGPSSEATPMYESAVTWLRSEGTCRYVVRGWLILILTIPALVPTSTELGVIDLTWPRTPGSGGTDLLAASMISADTFSGLETIGTWPALTVVIFSRICFERACSHSGGNIRASTG